MPGFASGPGTPAALTYVAAAWARLREQPRPAGWVLDLRGNSGGSIVPMVAGAGPLLGEGAWLSYRRRDGSTLPYRYSGGRVFVGGHQVLLAPDPPADDPDVPVAVLVDQRTASAAEGLLVAFRRRSRTHSVGVATAGLPTGNARYELSDGSDLFITTSIAVDRGGRSSTVALEPDSAGGLAEAQTWLDTQRPPGPT
jgi:carboxyl-terminal processing protease